MLVIIVTVAALSAPDLASHVGVQGERLAAFVSSIQLQRSFAVPRVIVLHVRKLSSPSVPRLIPREIVSVLSRAEGPRGESEKTTRKQDDNLSPALPLNRSWKRARRERRRHTGERKEPERTVKQKNTRTLRRRLSPSCEHVRGPMLPNARSHPDDRHCDISRSD